MPIWHCFWSSECAMEKIRAARYGEAENQWKENLRLIECVNNVNKLCVCVCVCVKYVIGKPQL
jgi:hypothetical protein